MKPYYGKLVAIGNPFSQKGEDKQRAAYEKSVAVLKEILESMKVLSAKIEKTKVPAEIAHEKKRLLSTLRSNIDGMSRACGMSFSEAKKAHAK